MKDCIQRAHDQGALTKQDAEFLKKKFDDFKTQGLSDAEAKQSVMAYLQAVAQEKERRALLTEEARKKIEQRIFSHKNRRGEIEIAAGYRTAIEDLEHRQKAVLGRWTRKLDEMILEFRKGIITGDRRRQGNWVGNDSIKVTLENVVRELHGENTKDAKAKAFAEAYREAAETARQEFNALGGNVGKLDNWFPHSHDQEALKNIGQSKWVEYMMGKDVLDRERMIHPFTQKPMTDAELKESLAYVWRQATSAGWFDREVTSAPVGKGALYKQHADHRFLHFKNADAWLKYSEQFGGSPDPWNAMVGHLEIMARDVAAMRMFGPNPDVMRNYIRNTILKRLASTDTVNIIHAEQAAEYAELEKVLFPPVTERPKGRTLDREAVFKERIQWLVQHIGELRRAGGNYEGTNTSSKAMRQAFTDLQETWQKLKAEQEKLFDLEPLDLDSLPQQSQAQIVARARMQELMDQWQEEIFTPSGNWEGRARRDLRIADLVWDEYRGKHNTPHDIRLANGFSTGRNLMVAAKLGSAMVSALSDLAFNRASRAFVGMDKRGVGAIVGGVVDMMKGASKAELIRAGFAFDTMGHNLQQSAKYVGSINTTAASGFLADRVISLSGLTAWTANQKMAYALDFQGFIADMSGKTLTELPGEVRGMLERNLITAREWDQIRTSAQYKPHPDSAGLIRPSEILAAHGEDLADKYVMMILKERRQAIMEPTIRTRAMMNWGTERGTWSGEFLRSAFQFKSFALTVAHLQGGRFMDEWQAGRQGAALVFAAQVAIPAVILGAVAIQLKELIAGRDPRPMDSSSFWGQALLQSGGLGIFGDFLSASENRFGGGMTATLAGPLAGEVDKLLKLTYGNLQELRRGEKTNFGRELVSTIGKDLPGMSLWYGRLAAERLFLDQLQKALDPEAYSAFARRVSQRKKDYGNEPWWYPGETAPRRGPDVTRAFGSN